jgi:GTP-binding protein
LQPKDLPIRNIAIIAHVDHGKTTLVDQLFKQSGVLNANITQADGESRIMDNLELERERGITIAAKNCSVRYGDYKINILDTPGHADFGGEVERALLMVDGVILLVDAAEGPLPQTRFVLSKALAMQHAIIVAVNKIDRKDARPAEVLQQIYDLFIDLGANDEQLDFPVLYTIGRDGKASLSLDDPGKDLSALFDTVIQKVPSPKCDPNGPFQLLVLDLGYSSYQGRLAIGRVFSGSALQNDQLVGIKEDGSTVTLKANKLQSYEGLNVVDIPRADSGEIVIFGGAEDITIGDTIAKVSAPVPLPRVKIDNPTISMKISINDSPFAGKEGKFVQPQRLYERLRRETLKNVSLHLDGDANASSFILKGRGEFQMAILVETMRREGFELSLGRPEVILKIENGKTLEPIEQLNIECEESHVGVITEKLAKRRGKMVNLMQDGFGRSKLEFSIPSRGLIGYRNEFLTDTRGTGIMHSILLGYEEHRGDVVSRVNGSLVADRFGDAVAYSLFNLEPRGKLIILPGVPVYPGMIIGEHNRENDLLVNACRTKKLTNIRAAGKDENIALTPVTPMTLEQAIEFIREDELVEVTPQSIRVRKIVLPKARVET